MPVNTRSLLPCLHGAAGGTPVLGLGDGLPYPGLGAVAAGHLAPGARDHLVTYALVRGLPISHNTVHRSRPWREALIHR